jgi:hypothetical protein
MAKMYPNISSTRPSKIYSNLNFGYENIPSGNPGWLFRFWVVIPWPRVRLPS